MTYQEIVDPQATITSGTYQFIIPVSKLYVFMETMIGNRHVYDDLDARIKTDLLAKGFDKVTTYAYPEKNEIHVLCEWNDETYHPAALFTIYVVLGLLAAALLAFGLAYGTIQARKLIETAAEKKTGWFFGIGIIIVAVIVVIVIIKNLK